MRPLFVKKVNHIDVFHIYVILRKKFGICLVVLSKTSHPQTNIGVKPCCLSEMPKVCIPSNHVLCLEYKIRLMHAERVGFLQKRWSRKTPVIFFVDILCRENRRLPDSFVEVTKQTNVFFVIFSQKAL